MTTRNIPTGFYVVNAAGQDVEWYMDLAAAIVAARHRPDGPCQILRPDGTVAAAPSTFHIVSED